MNLIKPKRHDSGKFNMSRVRYHILKFLNDYNIFLIVLLGMAILPLLFTSLMVLLLTQDAVMSFFFLVMAGVCAFIITCIGGGD